MSVWDHNPGRRYRSEISSSLPEEINGKIVKWTGISTMCGYVPSLVLIVSGCVMIYTKAEGNVDLSLKEGMLTFQGGGGAFCVLMGAIIILITRYRIVVKS